MSVNPLMQRVDALFAPVDGNVGERSVYSKLIDPATRRRALIAGAAAPGDILSVPIADVLAHSDIYLAPCGKRYVISGATLVDPCYADTLQQPESPVEEIAAVSPESEDVEPARPVDEIVAELTDLVRNVELAHRLMAEGYLTADAVLSASDDILLPLVGKRALNNINKARAKDAMA